MPYQPTYRYALLPDQAYSAYSRPRRDQEDGSYEIHLIKSGNPSYIPADFEVWPIYYNAVRKVLIQHPDVHDAAVAAAREIGQKLKGLENRDIPPAPAPSCDFESSELRYPAWMLIACGAGFNPPGALAPLRPAAKTPVGWASSPTKPSIPNHGHP